jgi:hypothetical protein
LKLFERPEDLPELPPLPSPVEKTTIPLMLR